MRCIKFRVGKIATTGGRYAIFVPMVYKIDIDKIGREQPFEVVLRPLEAD